MQCQFEPPAVGSLRSDTIKITDHDWVVDSLCFFVGVGGALHGLEIFI